MITAVRGKNFKNLSFTQELGMKNIFFGKNGRGKSARKEALILAINGPAGRQNSAVLTAYGKDDKPVEAGVQIGGTWFDRIFKKAKTSVTQIHKLNNKKVDKIKFAVEMGKAIGTVSAFDISSFTEASDKKQIAQVFDLFPPEGNVGNLEVKIEAAKTEINGRYASIRTTEALVAELTASVATTELPAGTLAGTVGDIGKHKEKVADVQKEIQNLKDAEAKRIANEEAKKKADEAAAAATKKAEEAAKEQAEETAATAKTDQKRAVKVAVEETKKEIIVSSEGIAAEQRALSRMPPKKRAQVVDPQRIASSSYDVGIEAIERIIQATGEMKACSGCFIGMLAKAELKKINALKDQEMIKF